MVRAPDLLQFTGAGLARANQNSGITSLRCSYWVAGGQRRRGNKVQLLVCLFFSVFRGKYELQRCVVYISMFSNNQSCPVCCENALPDMRGCDSCAVWFYQDFVELTADADSFPCPGCDIINIMTLCHYEECGGSASHGGQSVVVESKIESYVWPRTR